MALQDLTPQLRTRLSRVEHAVGIFVIVATVLLASGFGYYLYHAAQVRGWFDVKAPFYTYVDNAGGFKVGDKVKLMGFDAGEITRITAMPPSSEEYFAGHFVYVEFIVRSHSIYFSCEADEPLLPQALAYVGNDRIMYASDFPHWDHSYPKSVKELADRADLTDDAKRQVLAANARRFYKL